VADWVYDGVTLDYSYYVDEEGPNTEVYLELEYEEDDEFGARLKIEMDGDDFDESCYAWAYVTKTFDWHWDGNDPSPATTLHAWIAEESGCYNHLEGSYGENSTEGVFEMDNNSWVGNSGDLDWFSSAGISGSSTGAYDCTPSSSLEIYGEEPGPLNWWPPSSEYESTGSNPAFVCSYLGIAYQGYPREYSRYYEAEETTEISVSFTAWVDCSLEADNDGDDATFYTSAKAGGTVVAYITTD
jgi:hypothetical protein